MQSYPRETNEYVTVAVTGNGATVTSGVQFSIVPDGQRPGTWQAAVVRGSTIGFTLTGYGVGYWRVWAQATDTPYAPVIDCGVFQVT